MIIPILYSFFYLCAFQDPYGHLDSLSIAVVNNDKGANVNGSFRNLGNELTATMKNDRQLGWTFTDNSTAKTGVKSGKYFTAIFIPSNFSSDISTASTTDKKSPIIHYLSNEKSNYTASKIISSALIKLEEEARLNVDKSITSSLSDKLKGVPQNLSTLKNGLQTLDNGAQSLNNGVNTAADGGSQLLTGATSMNNGLQTLTGGAQNLHNATQSLKNGTQNMQTGAQSLGNGAQSLQSGAQSLKTGIDTAASGASQVSNGANSLNKGLQTLKDGSKGLSNGVGQAVGGLNSLSQGAAKEQTGLTALGTNLKNYSKLNSGVLFSSVYSTLQVIYQAGGAPTFAPMVTNLLNNYQTQTINSFSSGNQSAGITNLNLYVATNIVYQHIQNGSLSLANASSLQSDLSALTNSMANPKPYLSSALQSNATIVGAIEQENAVSAGQALAAQTQAGSNGNTTLYDGMAQIKGGADELSSKLPALQSGADQVTSGIASAASGSSSLADGASKLANGMPALSSGAGQVADGAQKLGAGANQLASGANQLNSGATQLDSGAGQLANGTASAASGSTSLLNGIQKFSTGFSALQQGSSQLSTGISTANKSVGDSLANANVQIQPLEGLDDYTAAPLSVKENAVYPVQNYGAGLAPYFISISLWAGALVMIAGLSLGKGSPANPTQMRRFAMMRVGFYYVMSFLQGFVLSIFLPMSLNMQVQNYGLYMLFNILIALAFVSLILFCVTVGGIFGSFTAVVLMVLQLTSCGGTFPLELSPSFFRIINPFLPMSYSVQLMRETISGFHGNIAATDVTYLAIMFIVLTILNFSITHIKTARKISQMEMGNSADVAL